MRIGRLAAAAVLLSCGGKTLEVGTNVGPKDAGPPDAAPPDAAAPTPETIARDLLAPPATLISDGTSLFWIDFAASGVWTLPVGGGTPTKIADDVDTWSFLYADANEVYYLATGGIDAVPKKGGPSKPLIAAAKVSVATVAENTAYWVEEDVATGPPRVETTALKSAPLGGGPARTLANLPSVSSYDAIAVTPTAVFLAAGEGLTTVPLDGGMPSRVSSTLNCRDLLGTALGVYCAQSPALGNPPLLLVTPGGRTSVIAAETTNARSLAVDAVYVYWVNDAMVGGGVVAVPRRGGAPVSITRDARCVAVAVDERRVYWSEEGGTILRVSK